MTRFAVIGAGPGGQSMAAVLADQGYKVALMDRDEAVIERLCARGSITLSGELSLTASPALLTTDAARAVEGAQVVLVVTTADAHEAVAASIAKALRGDELILLNPGMFLGSLAFRAALERGGCSKLPLIAETADLMYTCRDGGDGTVFHSGRKREMSVAALPASRTAEALEILRPVFPILRAADSILQTGLSGAGAVLHCVPMLMNVNRIDLGHRFAYYTEGITPAVARICEAMDEERVRLAKALGCDCVTVAESLRQTYRLEGENLCELIRQNSAYRGIMTPRSMAHRFCAEDTPASLVAFATVAASLGIATPVMDAVIELIGRATGIDYRASGRTAAAIGIEGKSPEAIREMIL